MQAHMLPIGVVLLLCNGFPTPIMYRMVLQSSARHATQMVKNDVMHVKA